MPVFGNIALKLHQSDVPTHITPLSKLKTATVVLDSSESEAQQCVDEVRKFFTSHNINAKIYALSFNGGKPLQNCTVVRKIDLTPFGWIGSKKKKFDRSTNLYLSLVYPQQWLDYYEARCSKAVFKAARYQTPQSTFDLVLTATDGKPLKDVFAAMADLLTKIR